MTAERYIAVFTGLFRLKKPGEYPYLCMGEEPLAPEGSYALRRSRPPCNRMGCEISFDELPEGCKRLVLDVYRDLWGLLLQDAEGAA
ncbi:MAG: hypothetical protein M3P92_10895 [Actinomycetota bacterium]|nr:hypothetical protein [Actinomycetota bacterium]